MKTKFKWEEPSRILDVAKVTKKVLKVNEENFGWRTLKFIRSIQTNGEEMRRIEFKTSSIPMNLLAGSKSSIDFIESLKNAENSEIFRT